ncbi:hypothetical protein KKD19_00050 [Patescibacteria group bacterium]|nr:hypothetical protein [Patescibacteria group bacterium]
MSNNWIPTRYVIIRGSEKVAVSGIPGCLLGEFRQLVPKRLKIIKGDPDLSEKVNQRFIGLKVISFLGPDDMKDLPEGHRVVFFRDIVASFEKDEAQEVVRLLELDGWGPDDAVDFAPEQFELIN